MVVELKKPYIEDGRLYLNKGQKGGSFGSALASLIPWWFGGEKLKRRRKIKWLDARIIL